MLVKIIMELFKNLFKGKKINANEVAILNENSKYEILDTYLAKYLGQPKMSVLWENSSPTSSFPAQTVTLSETITNFKLYTVIYKMATDNAMLFSNTSIVGYNQRTSFCGSNILNYREIAGIDDCSCTFGDNYEIKSYGNGGTVANQRCIPIMILGHNQ